MVTPLAVTLSSTPSSPSGMTVWPAGWVMMAGAMTGTDGAVTMAKSEVVEPAELETTTE